MQAGACVGLHSTVSFRKQTVPHREQETQLTHAWLEMQITSCSPWDLAARS